MLVQKRERERGRGKEMKIFLRIVYVSESYTVDLDDSHDSIQLWIFFQKIEEQSFFTSIKCTSLHFFYERKSLLSLSLTSVKKLSFFGEI